MREIKFRAWDKDEKRIVEIVEILGFDFPSEKVLLCGYKVKDEIYSRRFNELEILQFTSLIDKNGKEIYEGDIFDSPSKNKFKVIFENGCFCYQNIFDKHPIGLLKEIAKDWKIISNIYENPELLS
ncbi:MAG: YopX family protein [Nanoarchaeota archaeon]